MKAVILLLCLSLAQVSIGNIFKHQSYPWTADNLIEPSLNENQLRGRQEFGYWINPKSLQKNHLQSWEYAQGTWQIPKDKNEQWNWHGKEQSEKSPRWNKEHQKFLQKYKSLSDSSSSESSQDTKERNDENRYESTMQMGNGILIPAQPPFEVRNQMIPNNEDTKTKSAETSIDLKSQENDREIITKIYSDAYTSLTNSIDEQTKRKFHEAVETAAQADSEDARLNATQLLNKYQYEAEEHIIKTEDGYILTIFRIPPKRILRDVQKRPVVFLMHGLLGSADDWLLMGPGKSLAYLLSDAGYDVWMGNVRGSKYSRQHVWMHPDLPDFWHFSNDEISLIDLPAMIDYVLANTNEERLFYIGHSQGTTSLFALASSRPEYNAKIIMMYAMSPLAYVSNTRSPVLRMLAPLSQFEQQLENQLGDGEFNPNQEFIKNQMGGDVCEQEIGCKNVCSNAVFTISGVNIEGLDPTIIPVILGHWPAGTSTKLMKHYAQGVDSQGFRRYDYGPQINKNVYGELEPPRFMLENVTAPVSLYWSESDWLANPKDVEILERQLPSVKDSYKVPDQRFSNPDFQISMNASELVYERLLDSIQTILNAL